MRRRLVRIGTEAAASKLALPQAWFCGVRAQLQCGICTPGILVAAKNLLEKNPDPNEEQVRYWLAGNLCRCTGYDKIIRAVLDAAKEMRETS